MSSASDRSTDPIPDGPPISKAGFRENGVFYPLRDVKLSTPGFWENGVFYPEDDGEPRVDGTKQHRGSNVLYGNLTAYYRDAPDVFVAGDLAWLPSPTHRHHRTAPDVMVVFGRPKHDRSSYIQWHEAGIGPQVVFEVVSPGNRPKEMLRKRRIYETYGVQEYIVYDPDDGRLDVWTHSGGRLKKVRKADGWTSPLMGLTFHAPKRPDALRIVRPDGQEFQTFVEVEAERDAQRLRAEEETRRAQEEARLRAEADRRAEEAAGEVERLRAMLRALGKDPG